MTQMVSYRKSRLLQGYESKTASFKGRIIVDHFVQGLAQMIRMLLYLCASTVFSRRPFLPINCSFPSADVTKYNSPEDPDELETPTGEIKVSIHLECMADIVLSFYLCFFPWNPRLPCHLRLQSVKFTIKSELGNSNF